LPGKAEQQHHHHGTRTRERREQAAQHRKAEKSGSAPGDRPQEAADLGGEYGVVAQHMEQAIQARQRRDEGQGQ
jgi:hypothetical protein